MKKHKKKQPDDVEVVRLLSNQMNEEDLISRSAGHTDHNVLFRHNKSFHHYYTLSEGHANQQHRRDRQCK